MLSYQHSYHAGNLADLHKHALLSWALEYMCAKDKPLTYFETHAGRGLYDLGSDEALKTGEAAAGIAVAERMGWFGPETAFGRVLAAVRADHGATAYPGSPLLARHILRETDQMRLFELHPQEHAALRDGMGAGAIVEKADGLDAVIAASPPDPARGFLLVDPSYEVKPEYDLVPQFLARVHKRWGIGVKMLWYPILTDARHLGMVEAIESRIDGVFRHEVGFPPAREGHRMVGSGVIMVNAPYGIADEAARLGALFDRLG